mmetsp:Transcript_74277/g.86204  ORF Transcript_74277/g.86204 Transcript_74277/m.86204 type:complete len:270 (-) Transcript_74277:22-831(-)
MLHCRSCSLTMHKISVGERIFQQWGNGVDIIFAHLADIFKHKAQRFQHTVLDIKFRNSILIHKSWEHSEWPAVLSNDSNSNCCTDSVLSLLYFEIVQQSNQHILRTNSFGNITEGVDSSSSNTFLVSFEQVQQIEADSHPLLCRDVSCTSISNSSNQINTVFLHFLMSVLENRRQTRQKILDWRSHLLHTNDVNNSFQCSEDRTQDFWVLLTEILIKHDAKVSESAFLTTVFHDRSNTGDKISCLLSDSGGFIVQSPLNNVTDLRKIRL